MTMLVMGNRIKWQNTNVQAQFLLKRRLQYLNQQALFRCAVSPRTLQNLFEPVPETNGTGSQGMPPGGT